MADELTDGELTPPADDDAAIKDVRSRLLVDAVDKWMKQLVDVSGNNRLLFYKDLKKGTLDLSKSADKRSLDSLLSGRRVRLSQLFTSALSREDASSRMRTVVAKSKEYFEERGLRTMYLAWGMATWANSGSAATPAAPVLLSEIFVQQRGGTGEDFDIELVGDWQINPTLVHYLDAECGLVLNVDSYVEITEEIPISATKVFDKLKHDVRESLSGFEIDQRVVAGYFLYSKLPMVEDLKHALEDGLLAENEVISAIAGDVSARDSVRGRHSTGNLSDPDFIAPKDEFLVLDADASQSFVINAAVNGSDLVVEGPPGTGKSQTISNLIATLAARGKRVLFVAEKRAAIEAVTSRLEAVGLGNLVLDLHGGGKSKRELAHDLSRTLGLYASMGELRLEGQHAQLEKRRSTLIARNEALHSRRLPWGLSVFEIQSELLGIDEAAATNLRFTQAELESLQADEIQIIQDLLFSFLEQGGRELLQGVGPWSPAFLDGTVSTPDVAQAALVSAQNLRRSTIPAASQALEKVISECSLKPPRTIDDWALLLTLLDEIQIVLQKCDGSIYEQPLEEWITNLSPATKGLGKKFLSTLFDSNYRSTKKAAAALWITKPSTAELIATLSKSLDQRNRWLQQSVDGSSPKLPSDLTGTEEAYKKLGIELRAVGAFVGSLLNPELTVASSTETIDALLADQTTLYKLPSLRDSYLRLCSHGLEQLLLDAAVNNVEPQQAVQMVHHMWLIGILESVSFADVLIGGFNGTSHSRTVEEFVVADRGHISDGASRVQRAVAESAVKIRNSCGDESDLIAHQARLKRGHKPIRQLFQKAPNVLGAIKPCWAMSPLVVAELLPPQRLFDVVIFDEASQVTPADAIGALLRADRVIVAGDTKQLPPTSFFDASSKTNSDSDDEDDESAGTALTSDMESILDVMGALLPPPYGTRTLGWHYRSRDERLIAFSNAQTSLYDWSLTTFPGTIGDDCITHDLVAWEPGTPGQQNSSAREVQRVVDMIIEHAQTRPEESLGVIAMGIKHSDRITESLRRARANFPQLDSWFEHGPNRPGKPEPLFIKNLERVQGDERDAIILTIGYTKSDDGRMVYRFGPLNNVGGERRLNVAVTRARNRMAVVSSFGSSDLDPSKLNAEGAKMLGRYITYAESRGKDLGSSAKDKPELNPFERDIQKHLRAAGIPLIPQYGSSGYWIDFAAQHPEHRGEMVLAIECDGATYHSSPTARDRDRLRQEHLENLGWRFHRIWSTDWFHHREQEIDRARAAWKSAFRASDKKKSRQPTTSPSPNPAMRVSEPFDAKLRGEQPVVPQRDSSLKPRIKPGQSIETYNKKDLVALVRWIQSDTLLRTDEEIITEASKELGYKRRGTRIVDTLKLAVISYRNSL